MSSVALLSLLLLLMQSVDCYIQFLTAISRVMTFQDLQCHFSTSESVRALCNGGSGRSYRRTHLAELGFARKAARPLRTCQEVSPAAFFLLFSESSHRHTATSAVSAQSSLYSRALQSNTTGLNFLTCSVCQSLLTQSDCL